MNNVLEMPNFTDSLVNKFTFTINSASKIASLARIELGTRILENIEVFSSIERTLFDKKKLNEELKNISASPNMIVKILLFVPIVFMLLIYVLDPTYFSPLFESVLGYIIIGMIVIMFTLYALLLKRILKVEV